jgi:hypothetical protein
MLTNSANLMGAGELGWGFKSLAKGIAKGATSVVKKTVVAPTKLAVKSSTWVAKKTFVEPTKIVAKSAGRMATGTAVATGKFVRGDVTGAGKAFVKAGLEPVRGGAELTKQAGKTAYQASKAVTDLALKPIRSRLGTLKDRRAKLLAWNKRRSRMPTTVEKAQARKDVKSMLASKGPHGKMLSWLAGPTFAGELGVVGYDDAALAAIATALTASLVKIINDAAKSKFAPADAAKAGTAAGLTTAAQAISPTAPPPAAEEPAAAPATEEEVAAEPAAEAEEAATEEDTSNVEGVLQGLGWFDGFRGVVEEAAAPAAMDESTAKKVGSAAQRIICGMSAPALNAIGGVSAVRVAGSLCAAVSAGDDASVRRLLPAAVQIAARATNTFAAESLRVNAGGMPAAGFGDDGYEEAPEPYSEEWYRQRKARQGKKVRRYTPPEELEGITADELGMVAAFAGADPESLAFGLAGVDAADLRAAQDSASGSNLVLLPAILAVAAGLWMGFRG